MKRLGAVMVTLCSVGCGGASDGVTVDARAAVPVDGAVTPDGAAALDAQPAGDASVTVTSDGGSLQRPYALQVPKNYDPGKPTPLVILLHGYSAWGSSEEFYLGMSKVADDQTFLYATPDGTVDATGLRFWNATDGCCNFYGSTVDDVAYLDAIIEDVAARYNLDRDRVFIFGHSNGGFMAHRAACDLSPKIAAIVSLAGDNWLDWSKCNPTSPVSVLALHGDADIIVNYNGGTEPLPNAGEYPSAHGTVASWAHFNACPGTLTDTGTIDLSSLISGNETEQQSYPACGNGAEVSLWTLHGETHVPIFTPTAMTTIWQWMAAHPKIH